jgi:hypothetical protein
MAGFAFPAEGARAGWVRFVHPEVFTELDA